MGNDSSSLKGCTLETHYDLCAQTPCNIYGGTTTDGSKVSVFVYDKTSISEEIISNCVKYFKVLRHPGLVRLLGAEDKGTELWLITEHVRPMEHLLDGLVAEEVAEGLYCLLNTLQFLHQKARLCHNNLSLSSLFVTDDGSWKLGGLELVTSFTAAKPSFLAKAKSWRSASVISPEEKAERYQLTESLGHTRDVYAFGQLVQYLVETVPFPESTDNEFLRCVEDRCLNSDPRDRPEVHTLLEYPLFQNDFICMIEFIHNITIHSDAEREEFFKGLVPRLHALPSHLVAARLLKPLLGRFVMVDPTAREHLLPHLLTPRSEKNVSAEISPIIPEALFRKFAVPELFKIFHVRDAHIRIILLRHFAAYAHLFERNMLKAVIVPQILLGARDVNDELVALSLHALGHLVTLLGGNTVMGPQRVKLFTDGVPKPAHPLIQNNDNTPKVNGNAAGLSSSHKLSPNKRGTMSNEEAEKKRREKEKRREELKRKAEERKLKRQLKTAGLMANKVEKLKEVEEDDGGPADLNKQSQPTNQELGSKGSSQSEDSHDLTGLAENGSENNNQLNNSLQTAEEEDDQSDESFDEDEDLTDSEIDRQIEEELQAMSSPRHSHYGDTDAKAEVVKVDWSDVSSRTGSSSEKKTAHSHGVLVLKSSKTTTSSKPIAKTVTSPTSPESKSATKHSSKPASSAWESWEESTWEHTADSWQDVSPSPVSSPKPESSTPDKPATPARKTSRSSKPKVQLNEDSLDIKSIEFPASVSTEPDFFADMAPKLELQTGAGNLLDILPFTGTPEKSKKSNKFSVQAAQDDESEDQWDNEDWPDL